MTIHTDTAMDIDTIIKALAHPVRRDILDWLNVSGRVSIDNTHTDYTEKMYASTYEQLSEYSDRGMYGITKMTDKQVYGDVLVNINKTFGENWSLQANAGASISDMRYDAMKVRGPIASKA